MKWLKRIGIGILVLFVVLLVAKALLLDRSPVPASSSYTPDLAQIRTLAGTEGLPERLESLVIGGAPFPRTFAVAGGGFSMLPMVFVSYRVVYPDFSVVIDTGLDRWIVNELFETATLDDKAFDTMQKAMRGARSILLTHEHPDHIGGIPRSPYLEELRPKLLLTAEQIGGPSVKEVGFAPGVLESFTPLKYEGSHVVAPGLVVTRAPGHSPGSQLIYLKLANGAEFLFIGDIAWHEDNITELTGKAPLASMLVKEDTARVAEQLRAFYDLEHVQHDPIHLIVAHDKAQLERNIKAGLIQEGFQPGGQL